MLTNAQWAVLGRLVEACRPAAKVPPQNLRRTMSAILWRHDNGAKWRAVPDELGPWWMAAQTFIRWARLGVWERLLALVAEHDVQLGMAFLDGTNIRAHQKAAGASRRKAKPKAEGGSKTALLIRNEALVRRLVARVAAMAPRPA